MDLPDAIDLCLTFPGAEETTPFGPDVLVYKVAGKIFALTDPGAFPPAMNLKCDPARSIELRELHDAIRPGYHMNKRHWITVRIDGSLPPALLRDLISSSYRLVVASLTRKQRATLTHELRVES